MNETRMNPSGENTATVLARELSIGHGREAVVANLDFRLEPGKTLALVGSNGSGKTTLLKTIAGLLPPIAGTIEVLGARPLAMPARVAYMGQFHPSSFMLPLRAIDIVRMARFASHGLLGRKTAADEKAVHDAMALMGVEDLARKPLNTLSGGQRQKVFLAQTFAREADLILLDEPAANLDAPAQAVYRRFVRECARAGKAVVVATHDIDEAMEHDWTMLLARRVVAFGPCAEILTPQALLATFGIVGQYKEGRLLVVEREHGHQACGGEHEGPCKH